MRSLGDLGAGSGPLWLLVGVHFFPRVSVHTGQGIPGLGYRGRDTDV